MGPTWSNMVHLVLTQNDEFLKKKKWGRVGWLFLRRWQSFRLKVDQKNFRKKSAGQKKKKEEKKWCSRPCENPWTMLDHVGPCGPQDHVGPWVLRTSLARTQDHGFCPPCMHYLRQYRRRFHKKGLNFFCTSKRVAPWDCFEELHRLFASSFRSAFSSSPHLHSNCISARVIERVLCTRFQPI